MSNARSVPRALFLGLEYAGHRTRFANLKADVRRDPRLRSSFKGVSGWREGHLVERTPVVSPALLGRIRGALEASALSRIPRPDVIWTAASEVLVPHLWSMVGPLRRPLVLDLDWTLKQGEEMAPTYFQRPPKSGVRQHQAEFMERALHSRVKLFTPWSEWAAKGLRDRGVTDDRIMILPPGVDLDLFRPHAHDAGELQPLRLLFVGGDFIRKGGDLLLKAIRGPLAGECHLDIVTRDDVCDEPNVRVHRAEANSQAITDLYAQADVFVMPTRAEAYGIVTVEALASGLPVIVGDVGGARSIVDDGETGWLIPPQQDCVVAALRRAVSQRSELPAMGRRGREVAELRFDGKKNHADLVTAMVELAETGATSSAVRSSWIVR